MLPTPVLPIELLGEIIDDLDPISSQDRATLSAFSLSNGALSSMCQRRLFSQVTISLRTYRGPTGTLLFENEETTSQKFLDLLRHSPHLAQYVQAIEISLKVSIFVAEPTAQGYVVSQNSAFSLYAIISLLHDLKRFGVKASGWSLPWSNLEPEIRGFFVSVASRLEEIDLRPFYGIPTSVFSHSPALRKLHVSTLYAETTNGVAPTSAHAQTRLELLEIDHFSGALLPKSSDILSWFDPAYQYAIDISGLVHLKVFAPESPGLAGVLALSLQGLRSLNFKLGDWSYGKSKFVYGSDMPVFQSFPPPLDLGPLQDIRNLTIQSLIRHDLFNSFGHVYETDIPFISSIIKILPKHIIRRVSFITVIVEIHDVPDDLLCSIAWSKLIRELTDNAMYGVTLRLELQVFKDGKRVGVPALLRDIWYQEEDSHEIKEKGLVQIFF